MPPTGGPLDRTPPRLVEATPSDGALGVSDGTLRLTFSEALDEGSVARAVAVTPDTDAPLRVEANGRRVTVRLGDLRPNTTYVVTFDTGLRDLRGVPLTAPLTLAFSTGATIDRGTLAGRVVDGISGAPRGGVDVLAWPASDTLRGDSAFTSRPVARTQTGADGVFRLGYLGAAPLFVAAVEDRNRNRRIDAGEAVAAPPAPALTPRIAAIPPTRADSAAARDTSRAVPPPAPVDTLARLTWRLARADTTAPRPERARSIASTRLSVRFSEPVRLTGAGGWRLTDTTGADVPIRAVWMPAPTGEAMSADAPTVTPSGGDAGFGREVMVETPPLALRRHRLTTGAVRDTSGNAARVSLLAVTPIATPDTLRLRIAATVPDDGRLVPGEAFGLVLSRPFGADSVRLIVRDTLGQAIARRFVPDASGTRVSVVAATPFVVGLASTEGTALDSARRVTTFDARDLGSLSGRIERVAAVGTEEVEASAGAVVVVAEGAGRRFVTRAANDGAFAFSGLPAGPYRLLAWHDRDDDGRWTPGALRPWRAAEALARIDTPVTVRARWDTAMPDAIRL